MNVKGVKFLYKFKLVGSASILLLAFSVLYCGNAWAAQLIPWIKDGAAIEYEIRVEGSSQFKPQTLKTKASLSGVKVENTPDGKPLYSAVVSSKVSVFGGDGKEITGQIPSQTYDLKIEGEKVSVRNFKMDGASYENPTADTGSGLAPFLAYTGKDISAGKKFPQEKSQTTSTVKGMGSDGKDVVMKIDVIVSEKSTGAQENITTQLGTLPVWPVTYTITMEGQPAKVKRAGQEQEVKMNKQVTTVTDWFSPKYNMVIKSESTGPGHKATLLVTKVQ